jgi:hypothetical protein
MVTVSQKQLIRDNTARDVNAEVEYSVNPKDSSRRRFLKYVIVGGTVAGAYTAADAYLEWTPWGRLVRSLFTGPKPPIQGNQTTTTTVTSPTTTTPALSPLASYAKDKELSDAVIEKLGEKLGDKLTNNNKSFVDYLYGVSKTEVVSPEVLQFAPEEYRPSVVESLQIKTIDDVIKENKVTDQAVKSLGYLSGFPGAVQRDTIEFGLDDTTLEFLSLTAGLPDQEFAKYAVEWRVPIQDHKLTDLKRKFLQEPGNYAEDLFGEYVAEMMSAGNVYTDLAVGWEKLPESKKIDLPAVDSTGDFNDLFLNATNPEVKETGELILKGGTPYPGDFGYTVPNYNTELQVLNWLGRQNWFRRNDTLAQAIAMVNGLWVTMGTDEVRLAVYRDTNDMLNFGRETSEIQRALGLSYNLDDYPLEAKVCWAWRWNRSTLRGPYNFYIFDVSKNKVPIEVYNWGKADIEILKKMRNDAFEKNWISSNFNETIKNLENLDARWQMVDVYKILDELVGKGNYEPWQTDTISNIGYYYKLYKDRNTAILNCGDQTAFVGAWVQAVGIASTSVWQIDGRLVRENLFPNGHVFNTFFKPSNGTYIAYNRHFENYENWDPPRRSDDEHKFYIFVPPVNLKNCPWIVEFYGREFENCTAHFVGKTTTTIPEMGNLFLNGIPSTKMKKYIFDELE